MSEELNLEEIETRCRLAELSEGEMYYAEAATPIVEKDVPALINEVRRLRAVNDRSTSLVKCVTCDHGVRAMYAIHGMCHVCAEEEIERLREEKESRIYYQDIVYSVCNSIDRIFARPHPLVCGTKDHPTKQVQEVMAKIERLLSELPEKVGDGD